jgi:GT2 family glycosyltransferase
VENASGDGTLRLVHEEFPEVVVIENKKNEGYARGVNQGANNAAGRYLLILNPDTELNSETLQILFNFLKNQEADCIVGAHTVDGTGKSIPACRSLPHIGNITRHLIAPFFNGNRLKTPRRRLLDMWEQRKTVDVTKYDGYIAGACILTELDFFKRLGMFDDRYFLYYEDADMGFRIKQAGYPAFLVAEASLVHYAGRSAAYCPQNRLYAVESCLRYLRKNFTFSHRMVFQPSIILLLLSWTIRAWLKGEQTQKKVLLESLKRLIPPLLGGKPIQARDPA